MSSAWWSSVGRIVILSEDEKESESLIENFENLQQGHTAVGVSNNINNFASKTCKGIAEEATNDPMTFLSSVEPGALCVTYFDEAHGLKSAFWVLLRLLMCS
jgi:hypothetical protein